MQVFTTRTYERAIRKLLSEDDRREMEAVIAAAPSATPVIPGTGGIRKLRWAGSGRGKRGGIRKIYFHHAGPGAIYTGPSTRGHLHGAIYMLTAYAKAARDNLSTADRKALSRLVATIRKEETDT